MIRRLSYFLIVDYRYFDIELKKRHKIVQAARM